METDLRLKIDEIVGPMYCPEEYSCVSAGLERLRNVGVDGQGSFLLCLQADAGACAFVSPRGGKHECRCALRASLSQKLS